MKNIITIINHDFKNFLTYRIIHMIVIISAVFALAMGIFHTINPLIFVYISIFIITVITNSVTLFIEKEEQSILPIPIDTLKITQVIPAKLLSSLILQLIPMLFYLIIMKFILNSNFSTLLFIITYILGLIIHIMVGFSITLICNNHVKMALMYVGYIILFSLIPFLSLMNLIPSSLSYLLIVSPGYSIGILFENIFLRYLYSDLLLVILASVVPIIYVIILLFSFIKPYYTQLLKVK